MWWHIEGSRVVFNMLKLEAGVEGMSKNKLEPGTPKHDPHLPSSLFPPESNLSIPPSAPLCIRLTDFSFREPVDLLNILESQTEWAHHDTTQHSGLELQEEFHSFTESACRLTKPYECTPSPPSPCQTLER